MNLNAVGRHKPGRPSEPPAILAARQMNTWPRPIPVSERLPECTDGISDEVLCYRSVEKRWYTARYDGEECDWESGDGDIYIEASEITVVGSFGYHSK